MPRFLLAYTLALTCASFALACGGSSGPSTDDLRAELPVIALAPEDISAIETGGSWSVQDEGEVTGGSAGELSDGLISAASAKASVQPLAAYERTIEGTVVQSFRARAFPPIAYSAIVILDSSSDAADLFAAAEALARDADWLSTNPALDGTEPQDPQLEEPLLALAETVDQVLWLHFSARTEEGDTISDDLLLVRDGRLFALVRAPGYFAGDSRTVSSSTFEGGLIIPVASRLHDAAD